LVNTLVTVIIPSENSLEALKTTIDNLLLQAKCKGIRVMVLDKSIDGSIQYASQASSELLRNIRIEPIGLKANQTEFDLKIETPYCIWITPGTIFKDRNFLIDEVNKISVTRKNLIYTEKERFNLVKFLFPFYTINSKKTNVFSVLCNKTDYKKVWYQKNSGTYNLTILDVVSEKNYKVVQV
jgi:hypothetical protein